MGAQVQVLGTIGVLRDGELTPISSRSQRVVLAVLAAHLGSTVSTDALVDALWNEQPPPSAVRSLRTYVSRLRKHLGDAISASSAGYRLALDGDDVDHCAFERLADEGSSAVEPVMALASLDRAMALWKGTPFADVGDIETVRPVAVRLEERRATVLEARIAALVGCGRAAEAVAAGEEFLADHPLRERAWIALIDGLIAMSRPTEALRAYQRAVETLADAGLEPTAELRDAEAAAFEGGDREQLRRRPLSRPASSFVGRVADRGELPTRIARGSLVTLVGPGGVGKTRLAREVAADMQDRFGAGVRIVELAGVEDPEQIPAVVASGLELTIGPGGVSEALEAAGELDVLVLIDNCEHVADAAAASIRRLTSRGGRLRVLATSREPLSIDGEQLWPVTPLPTEGGAVRLFLDRVESVRPGFAPSDDERKAILEIVGRLDGLPLAVEMAAAAARTVSLSMLNERLDAELDLPAMTRRDLDERQRTLRALVDWSLRLIDDEARELFVSMAVFAGQPSATDVATVSGHADPFDALCRLADHSLIHADPTGGETRFGMLRTVRQRALDLGRDDADGLRRRHAQWVVDVVARADRQLRGSDERPAHDRIEAVLDDTRAALVWARTHDLELAVRLAAHLHLFAQSRLRDEILGWSSQLVDEHHAALTGRAGALVLTAAAQRATNFGDIDTAEELSRRALSLDLSTTPSVAFEVLSDVHLFRGDVQRSIEVAEEGLGVALRESDPHAIVVCIANLVLASAYAGDHERAERWMARLPDRGSLSSSDAAWIDYLDGERTLDADPTFALAAFERAIETADQVGNTYLASLARVSYVSVLSRAGAPDAASGPFTELLAHWRSHGDRAHLLTTLRNLVIALDRMRRDEQAAELLGTVIGDSMFPSFGSERDLLDGVKGRLAQSLGSEHLERRMDIGRRRSVIDAALVAERWLAAESP